MKNGIKTIVLSVGMFVAGIITTIIVASFFVLPDLAMDVAKLAYEGANNGYEVGCIDGANGDTDMYDKYFNNDDMKELDNWEYKYIR